MSKDKNTALNQSPEEESKSIIIPQYESAIRDKDASFANVAETHFGMEEKFNKDPARRLAHARYHPKIVEVFEAKHGHIVKVFYADNVLAAAVLTSRSEFEIVHPLENVEIGERFFQCERTSGRVQRLLKGVDLALCMDMLYSLATHLLNMLDAESDTSHAGNKKRLIFLDVKLREAEDFCGRAISRIGQVQYFLGMVGGSVALILGAIACGLWLPSSSIRGSAVDCFLGSLIAGGLGAVLSVLSRMTAGNLYVDYDVGARLMYLLGGFRPIIGSIFGVAVYMWLASGLLPVVAAPTDPLKQLYFYCGIGVIAGFNERWAQDMLLVSQDRVGKRNASAKREQRLKNDTDMVSSTPQDNHTSHV